MHDWLPCRPFLFIGCRSETLTGPKIHFYSRPEPGFLRDSQARKVAESNRLERKVLEAATGDLDKEEALLLKIQNLGVDEDLSSFNLATIYAARGQEKLTYKYLHRTLFSANGGFTSFQEDPVTLTYYGDLCIRLEKQSEARWAYLNACRHGFGWTMEPYKSLAADIKLDWPLDRLRAAALASSASGPKIYDEDTRSRYARESVALDPVSPLNHIVYATVAMATERVWGRGLWIALFECWQAENVAPPDLKPILEDYRKRQSLFYSETIGEVRGGQEFSYQVPYEPPFPYHPPQMISGFKTVLVGPFTGHTRKAQV